MGAAAQECDGRRSITTAAGAEGGGVGGRQAGQLLVAGADFVERQGMQYVVQGSRLQKVLGSSTQPQSTLVSVVAGMNELNG